MSYAIIRNEKYTKDEMIQLAPHNERFKKKYSNKNIDLSKTSQNYHLKLPKENTYLKEYNRLIKENNLSQGQVHKNSIYVCEVILTSDNTFFNRIGKKETKRYFQECFNFMTEYKEIGKENILTAVVHLDEETPHMHLVYIPVVNAKDKKGNPIRKISASEFWKGKDSYKKLQNQFYNYITEKGFNLERGKENKDREHISTDDMKKLTNFYNTKQLKENLTKQKEQIISYEDVQEFYKYEDFTKDNVDKKLIYPILKYNNSLVKQNHDLLLELSKTKNAKKYYSDLQIENNQIMNENQELEEQLRMNNIELNACYKIIKELLNKNKKIEKILKDKLGIEIINDKDNNINNLNKYVYNTSAQKKLYEYLSSSLGEEFL